MDNRDEIREFLSSRRARLSPAQAGLPFYGGKRRVAGCGGTQVALLASWAAALSRTSAPDVVPWLRLPARGPVRRPGARRNLGG